MPSAARWMIPGGVITVPPASGVNTVVSQANKMCWNIYGPTVAHQPRQLHVRNYDLSPEAQRAVDFTWRNHGGAVVLPKPHDMVRSFSPRLLLLYAATVLLSRCVFYRDHYLSNCTNLSI
jgi:hypothetical protein